MIDPIQLVLIFFGFTMLFLVAIGAFVFKMQHILEAIKMALEAIQKSTQGTWYVSHDQKSTMEGVRSELQQQNKYIKKKEGVIISGPLPGALPDTGPVAIAPNKSRKKKEHVIEAATSTHSTDVRYDVTLADLPAIPREGIRS